MTTNEKPSPDLVRLRDLPENKLLRRSLELPKPDLPFLLTLTLGSIFVSSSIWVLWPPLTALGLFAFTLLADLAINRRRRSRVIKNQIEWLTSLPFKWNYTDYLDILETRRRLVALRLVVRFAILETYRSATSRDLASMLGTLTCETLDGNSVAIDGPIVPGYEGGQDGPTRISQFTNQWVHSWFKNLITNVILPIHQEYPIESLTVIDVSPPS